jgi:exopolysaccharide biosynthesis polyprenyl glycosylphosphotransferase
MRNFWKSKWLTVALVALDAAAFAALWLVAYELRRALNPQFVAYVHTVINPIRNYVHALPVVVVLWIIFTAYYGHYSHREKISALNQLSTIFKASIGGLISVFVFSALFKYLELGRSVVIMSSVLIFFYLYCSRSFLRYLKRTMVSKGYGLTNVVIVGAGETGRQVRNRIVGHPEIGFNLVGFIDNDPAKKGQTIDGVEVLGTVGDLLTIVREKEIEEVFLAVPNMPQDEIMNLVVHCEETGVVFKIVSNIFDVITSQVKIDEINEIPVVRLPNPQLAPFHAALKRLMDLVVAGVLLIPAIPVGALIVLFIRLDSKGKALFTQTRIGKGGKTFTMYKFRTMHADVEPYEEAPLERADPRITRFGRFLRKTSLDELPQLINVIKGDMSMVGPRPEMPFIVERYEEWQRRRLDVKPGITGLWQIVGRKDLPLYLNLEYDFYYIRHQSLLLDLTILIKTIPAVLFGKGAF